MTDNVFGENLKKLREKNHLSRKALAEKLGLSEQSIHYYETGKRETNFETLIKISDLFNVSTDYLLRGSDSDDSISYNLDGNALTLQLPENLSKEELQNQLNFLNNFFKLFATPHAQSLQQILK